LQDIVTRYACSTGRHVTRRFGWDCHGLPVEHEIDKMLGVKSRTDVLDMGIDVYNEECRSIVMRYSKEWEAIVRRLGRWIDFKNDYKTMDPSFMESVWWVFKQLYDKGLVYRGFKVMPYSTACSTPLSNFEAGQNYKDVSDPAVVVAFPVDGDADGAALVAWTTTPWTLPSNLALCVNPEMDYVKAKDPATGKCYIVAECRLGEIPGAVPKAKKAGKKGGEDAAPQGGFEILSRCKGADLVGLCYQPLFPYYAHLKSPTTAFRVLSDAYVTSDSGTGIVHQAPAFGEDDYRVCLAAGVIAKGEGVPCPVDESGCFMEPVVDFLGRGVKDADKDIIVWVKSQGRLVHSGAIVHPYPFCWRSDTPLIYKAVPSWFVRVEEIKPRLLANNQLTRWVPDNVREKRFHNWLENARDWAISRSRFWGTPIPIWASEDREEIVVVGSVAELEELTGTRVTDLHRHFIDHLEIPSQKPGGKPLKRVDDVFDCWFESGKESVELMLPV
jgi:isoleucyl-tRNA synthetase